MAKVNVGIETSSWINIIAGVVVAGIAYYQTTSYNGPFWSGIISGALLVVIGAYTAWAAASGRERTAMWPSGGSLLVGLWLAAYPWFVGVTNAYFYTTVITGAFVAIVSGYEMYAANNAEKPMKQRPVA